MNPSVVSALGPAARLAFRALLGSRLPRTSGKISVEGTRAPISIDRDRHGVPHIRAENDDDAWFGLGFCQGQDRTFQVELLVRAARGQLSELLGPERLGIDRISRRIGFTRAARAQLAVQRAPERAMIEAFARGFNSGATHGRSRLPHELTLLRVKAPLTLLPEDVPSILGLMSFLLASNWDAELARYKMLELDGESALRAVDHPYPGWLSTIAPPGGSAGKALANLERELGSLRAMLGGVGGSNNWALAGSRTSTGKPLLANDPHLGPLLPAQWYLAHLITPSWQVAGACLAGAPGVVSGHNGSAAWGVTAGMIDNTDLFLEDIGADGKSVREGDRFVPVEVVEETIAIRGKKAPHVERVLVTPRGPVIGSALDESPVGISLAAAWLKPLPIRGILHLHRTRDFAAFRAAFDGWNALTLNYVYADAKGDIGWQMIGQPPIRKLGATGLVPTPAWVPGSGWESELAPFEGMPNAKNPDCGFLCTANNRPYPVGESKGAYLGEDFLDGYRATRIQEELSSRKNWDVASTLRLQIDARSILWREVRAPLLAALEPASEGPALSRLRDWSGEVGAEEPGAALFELLIAELTVRAARSKAPRSYKWALGKGFADALAPHTLYGFRTQGWISALLREKPTGWFAEGWDAEIRDAFQAVTKELCRRHGQDPDAWAWGRVRPLVLQHPLGAVKALRPIFNRGPIPWGGDTGTITQATVAVLSPFDPPVAIANYRMVVDLADVSRSRFALAGGQSGNPLSDHYDDLLPHWLRGSGIPIAWTGDEVRAARISTLRLTPAS